MTRKTGSLNVSKVERSFTLVHSLKHYAKSCKRTAKLLSEKITPDENNDDMKDNLLREAYVAELLVKDHENDWLQYAVNIN
jgi:hypothetical protein